ncbi:hypothetical protein BV20DRAFT_951821 [Pilatotrama ljubarskyi]|nr:hypothetical protein BV20DRAFT_951821 [Pilatotrama ljubarskyi]
MSTQGRYTCEIVFHSAENVPLADLNDLASDPYISATLVPSHPGGNSGPKSLESISFRTQTARRTLNPTFNARWIVSGIPASGFVLILYVCDEDPGNRDDKLGKAVVCFPDPNQDLGDESTRQLKEGWDSGQREYKVHKRHGSLRTRIGTYLAKVATRGRVGHRTRVLVSVRVLGPAPRLDGEDAHRIYTLGPHVFVRHFSPLAARLTWVRSFIANRLQLTGPVPAALRHRYVGFAPFVKAMFRARGVEGILLNRTLHRQHRAIYKWDANTIWGVVGQEAHDGKIEENGERQEGGKDTSGSERTDEAFARKFLEMAAYGTEGRIFTYVMMLDGEWRFTETGEEFAIQLLSKHTMHADVALEIAYSGEFFVRLVHPSNHPSRTHHAEGSPDGNGAPPQDGCSDDGDVESETDHPDPSSLPPSAYELVIDNDSGTYRPNKDLLPTLADYLSRPSNLGALGRIRAMDGFDERLKRWKERRAEIKKRARGGDKSKGVARQASVSSSSSSSSSSSEGGREAAERAREDAEAERRKLEGDEAGKKALVDDVQRAEDNQDSDPEAREEKRGLENEGRT